ncbi:Verlamelin biosynthesis B [Hyphodiscus hymeniophilus]|uniref:Verlamelin biosynthesis B n=1 Tax=Hyphodiscus hymeniophilus TaxID=353542 RepID=A0A9P7AYP1_9HELO|nr:Verlamelin biosynthesis B [Hyphodiscus hymeniophilus]
MEEPDLAHFTSIPWCSAILSNPAYKTTPTFSRHPKPTTEDSLIAVSLSSPSTISHCLSLYVPPASPETFVSEIITLLTLGAGMNGGVDMLHGGIIATLLDDVMGTLLTVNKDRGGVPLTQGTVTASLSVRYLKGVRTPGTVAVWARCRRREGRRFWLEGEVRDAEGMAVARGEAVWVRVDGKVEKEKEKGRL